MNYLERIQKEQEKGFLSPTLSNPILSKLLATEEALEWGNSLFLRIDLLIFKEIFQSHLGSTGNFFKIHRIENDIRDNKSSRYPIGWGNSDPNYLDTFEVEVDSSLSLSSIELAFTGSIVELEGLPTFKFRSVLEFAIFKLLLMKNRLEDAKTTLVEGLKIDSYVQKIMRSGCEPNENLLFKYFLYQGSAIKLSQHRNLKEKLKNTIGKKIILPNQNFEHPNFAGNILTKQRDVRLKLGLL